MKITGKLGICSGKWFLLLTTFCLLLSVLFIACSKNKEHEHHNAEQTSEKYYCPMHPNYISDKPGDCPICGMKLVKDEKKSVSPESSTKQKEKKIMYKSTMHPNEVSDRPGKDSMGMEMVPFEVEEKPTTAVKGLSTITIPLEKQQLIGVKTAIVKKRDVFKTIKTVGNTAHDPELYFAEQEYITSFKTYQKIKDSSQAEAIKNAKDLMESAKFKLNLLGFNNEQIEELEKRGVPDEGLLITEESENLWVYATIYEYDLKYVKINQEAKITSSSVLNESISGKVITIDPVLNPETRSAKVRILVNDKSLSLKHETFVNVEIKIPLGMVLTLPDTAVMDTGIRQIIFIDKGNGIFEPREIKVSEKINDYYIIKSGVSEGERVVSSANFLIDSESQLKSILQDMSGEQKHSH